MFSLCTAAFNQHIKSQTVILTFSGVLDSMPSFVFFLTVPSLTLKQSRSNYYKKSSQGHNKQDLILHTLIVKAVGTGWMLRLGGQTHRPENVKIDCRFPTKMLFYFIFVGSSDFFDRHSLEKAFYVPFDQN